MASSNREKVVGRDPSPCPSIPDALSGARSLAWLVTLVTRAQVSDQEPDPCRDARRDEDRLHGIAADRLLEVVAARDRDRDALPLDFEALSGLDIPVLLIHGMQDVVIPVSRTWELLNTIQNADSHIFGRCGHWTQIECAGEFNDVVCRFLTCHGVTPSHFLSSHRE